MIKLVSALVFLACSLLASSINAASPAAPEEDWVYMPAGAKPSYMGIHGGTMPVSLLVSDDGDALLTFVGRTGNDFLEALRRGRHYLPSFSNSTRLGLPVTSSTNLFAGNATASMPVFSLSGGAFADFAALHDLEPFGLSDERLEIEGAVTKPSSFPHARSLRLFSLPDYFQPRRAASQSN